MPTKQVILLGRLFCSHLLIAYKHICFGSFRRLLWHNITLTATPMAYNSKLAYYHVEPATRNQADYMRKLATKPITICYGPPGTGKTLLAMHRALQLYANRQIEKIYYVRNECNTEHTFGAKPRGAVPGDKTEKDAHLLGPVRDNLYKLVAKDKADYMLTKGLFECMRYEDLMGRSFDRAYLICDEAQNVPPPGIRLVLSRLCESSYMALIGDNLQKASISKLNNGLADAVNRLDGLHFVGITQMGLADIQRNGWLGDLLSRYDI